jgi:hypothetical protein
MFESIEVKKVENGVIVTLHTQEDDELQYVFDTDRKAIKFIKETLESKRNEK